MLGFDPAPGHVLFMVYEAAVVLFLFLRVLPFSPFIVIFHTYIHVPTYGVVEYILSVINIIVKHDTEYCKLPLAPSVTEP